MPLFITEFQTLGGDARGGLSPIAMTPSLADQTVAIGAATTQSAVLNVAIKSVFCAADGAPPAMVTGIN